MGAPPVVVLDEPTNELDPARRRAFWRYLAELNREGLTVILTTHNLTEAEQVVERVAVIDRGKLVALGTPGELKRQVASHVRLEIRLKEEGHAHVAERLSMLQGCQQLKPNRWELTAPQNKAATLLPMVIELVGFENLDDFRLVTPTMEDVYVYLTGQRWEEHDGVNSA